MKKLVSALLLAVVLGSNWGVGSVTASEESGQQAELESIVASEEYGDVVTGVEQVVEDDHAEDEGHGAPEFIAPAKQGFKYLVAGLFVLAILHTFLVKKFADMAHKYPQGSVQENLFHLLGEVEAVFVIWSGVLVSAIALITDWGNTVGYLEGINYTEPIFVFVIMIIAGTRPVIDLADWFIRRIDTVLPMKGSAGFLATVLILGPLLGSVITEPAAMTVSALILLRGFFSRRISKKLKYMIIATLFVNISIGGSLTNFAAPPVIIVANTWNWDLLFMLTNFGWKAALAVIINAYLIAWLGRKELNELALLKDSDARGQDAAEFKQIPFWVSLTHVVFLVFTVLNAHHPAVFIGGFLFFLGFATVTQEYQERLKLRESLLVAGFLAGLITMGSLQSWWIQPIIQALPEMPLFFSALALTSVTDNAALTFLASQVENLSMSKQYLVVAGALAGGGLTVIANAPNPAGYSILNPSFGKHGINPLKLLKNALLPTAIAVVCLIGLGGY